MSTPLATLNRERPSTHVTPVVGRQLLLTVHVPATVGLFGADLALVVLGTSTLAGADARSMYPSAHLIGVLVVQPLAIVSLFTGVVAARLSGWGLLRYWWTATKLAITLALTVVVLLVLVPRLGAAAGAPDTARAAESLILLLGPAIASSLLLLNVVLAIYKPRWRLRSSADPTPRSGIAPN